MRIRTRRELGERLAARPFLDGVHTVGMESDVILDRGDRGIRSRRRRPNAPPPRGML
jgi:hypothetical protein